MKKIYLNYIYLSEKHAGGKDQVGLNLLCGLQENGVANLYYVICYEHSEKIIKKCAPDIKTIVLPSRIVSCEFERLFYIMWDNTFTIPTLLKKKNAEIVLQLSCNNGLVKMPCISVEIPHDIKQISHRVLGNVKVSWYKYALYKILYSMDFRHADYIIAISDTDKSEITEYYEKYKKKIYRIYNPIIIKRDKAEIKSKRFNEPYICALNLQFHHKNIITLIKAYERIKNEINCKLILIGKIPNRMKYLVDYVNENDLKDDVIFTGFLDDEDVEIILANAELYINPSLNEGFGMTSVEAMMMKVPTLLSDIPTNREISKGLCRYYYPAQDVDALSTSIIECINKKNTTEELDNARIAMINEYDYKKIAEKYHVFLSKIH